MEIFVPDVPTAVELLNDGNKVKVTVMFRGREITHPELGFSLLQRMAESLKDIAVIDQQPSMEGRRMNLILSSTTIRKAKTKEEVKEIQNAKA